MRPSTVYLDNAAATRLDERVLEAMVPYYLDTYAVATSQFGYSLGIEAKEALEGARATIADRLRAPADSLVFTSGDTEASNMAIKGVALALGEKKGRHIVSTGIEDFAVLYSVRSLERLGFEVTQVALDEFGRVDLDALRAALRPDTVLVSIQAANQEIGTLQNLAAIGEITRERGVLLHTDASHSFPRVELDVTRVPVDLVTLTAHLIHGPAASARCMCARARRWPNGWTAAFRTTAAVASRTSGRGGLCQGGGADHA